MTRHARNVKLVAPHDCYQHTRVQNPFTHEWVCPICGIPYLSMTRPRHQFPPPPKAVSKNLFWMNEPDLMGAKGHCNGDGSLLLVPGDKVHLKDIKANVFVTWRPWEDYSKKAVRQ